MKRLAGILLIVIAAMPSSVQADTSSVVISHIQAGVTGGATQEVIVIHNNSSEAVEITDWCLKSKNDLAFACFREEGYQIYLEAWTSVVMASQAYLDTHPEIGGDLFIYQPTNQSSGSLVGSSDVVKLIDDEGNQQDSYRWTATWPSGSLAQRQLEDDVVRRYRQGTDNDWMVAPLLALPESSPTYYEEEMPECTADCQPPTPLALPFITEILPNAEGSDDGKEYIELFNPSEQDMDMSSYSLGVHGTTSKSVSLPEGSIVPARAYLVLYNTDIAYTLLNTSGYVSVSTPEGVIVSETAVYDKPADDMAWALIADVWQYTDQPTPGADNLPSLIENEVSPVMAATTLKPCAENQYRHPDTKRCRNNPVPTQIAACKVGYYRSAETNRCRKIAATTAPAPCKEGQERHPDTGRCRTVKQMTVLDPHTLGVVTENRPQQWYVVWVIVGLMAALVGYGAWEWRADVKRIVMRTRAFLVKSK